MYTLAKLAGPCALPKTRVWFCFLTFSIYLLQLPVVTTVTVDASVRRGVFMLDPFSFRHVSERIPKKAKPTIRLMGGEGMSDGRLEIKVEDKWGSILLDQFDLRGAAVACTQLGFGTNGGVSIYRYTGKEQEKMTSNQSSSVVPSPIIAADVRCKGTETTLQTCSGRFGTNTSSTVSNILTAKLVGIRCPTIRIAQEEGSGNGRLEIWKSGDGWGTVCHDGHFDAKEIGVACRQLGYLATGAHVAFSIEYQAGTPKIVMAGIKCSGDENSLSTCNSNLKSRCLGSSFQRVVGLTCSLTPPKHAQVRLVPRPSNLRSKSNRVVVEGRLEVYVGQQWGTACDRNFDISEAKVVCRQLGYRVAQKDAYFTYGGDGGGLRILANDLECAGFESSLQLCKGRFNSPQQRCTHGDDVGVRCVLPALSSPESVHPNSALKILDLDGDYVASGSAIQLYDGLPKTTLKNCKQRCASHPLCQVESSEVGMFVKDPSHPLYGRCKLGRQLRSPPSTSICTHGPKSNKAQKVCVSFARLANVAPPLPDVRLYAGVVSKVSFQGRLELLRPGPQKRVWGSVCDSGFGWEAATVTCQSLGFPSAESVYHAPTPRQSAASYLLPAVATDLRCTGKEGRLRDCVGNFGPFHTSSNTTDDDVPCPHEHDVAISCTTLRLSHASDLPKSDAKLPEGAVLSFSGLSPTAPRHGRLEMYAGEKWGTVCNKGFDDREARVACRQLGFKGVSRFYSSGSKGVSGLAIVAANLGCSGSEHAIRDCKGTFNSQGLTQCNHEDDVGLICASDDSQAIDTRVRIQNGGPAGRLEMYVMEQTPKYGLHGQWGTVCNDGFDTAAAMVACREMGFAAGEWYRIQNSQNDLPVVATRIACTGNEQQLVECPGHYGQYLVNNACSHEEDVGLRCQSTPQQIRTKDGRLEVLIDKKWGTICYAGFTNVEATVACKQMQYRGGGEAFNAGNKTMNETAILGTNINCDHDHAKHPTLRSCPGNWSQQKPSCPWHDVAGVHCKGSRSGTDIRLYPEGSNKGRLEISFTHGPIQHSCRFGPCHYHKTVWGTVCRKKFDLRAAAVACRQLGFPLGGVPYIYGQQGSTNLPVVAANLVCKGNERRLHECQGNIGESPCTNCRNPRAINRCPHEDDIGLECFVASTTSTTTPHAGPAGPPQTPSKEIPVNVYCVKESYVDPAVLHILPGGGSSKVVENKGLRQKLRLPGARLWIVDTFTARLRAANALLNAPTDGVKQPDPSYKIPTRKTFLRTVNQSNVYGPEIKVNANARNVSITCFTSSRVSVTDIALDSTDPNLITSPLDPYCNLMGKNEKRGDRNRWMYCSHGAVLDTDPTGPHVLGLLALKIHVSLVGFKTITCTHTCGGDMLRSRISTHHYISLPAPKPPKVNTGQTYCHKRFTSRNTFPVPAFTPVQLLVPQYEGWPRHHFVCYVQGHLDLPPPACPALGVPRYQTGNVSAYDYSNAVNDFNFYAMCAGGTHVRKYSSLMPPVIMGATTIRAIACTFGGSSAVSTYGFIVVEPPAAPRMLLHPGNQRSPKAIPVTGYNNNVVADSQQSNDGLWIPYGVRLRAVSSPGKYHMYKRVASSQGQILAEQDLAEREARKELSPRDPKYYQPPPPPPLPPVGEVPKVSAAITCATVKAGPFPGPEADVPRCLCGTKAHPKDSNSELRPECAPGSHLVSNKAGVTLSEHFLALKQKYHWDDDPARGNFKLITCYSVGGLLMNSSVVEYDTIFDPVPQPISAKTFSPPPIHGHALVTEGIKISPQLAPSIGYQSLCFTESRPTFLGAIPPQPMAPSCGGGGMCGMGSTTYSSKSKAIVVSGDLKLSWILCRVGGMSQIFTASYKSSPSKPTPPLVVLHVSGIPLPRLLGPHIDRTVDLNIVNRFISSSGEESPPSNATIDIGEVVMEHVKVHVASSGGPICYTFCVTRGGQSTHELQKPTCVDSLDISSSSCGKDSHLYDPDKPPELARPQNASDTAFLFRYSFIACGYQKQSPVVSRSFWLPAVPAKPLFTSSGGRMPQGAAVKIKTREQLVQIDTQVEGHTVLANRGAPSEVVCYTVSSQRVPPNFRGKLEARTPSCALMPFECGQGSLLYVPGTAITITGVAPAVLQRGETPSPTRLITLTTVRVIACSFGGQSNINEAQYNIVPPATWPLGPVSDEASNPTSHITWTNRRMKLTALAADDICYTLTLDAGMSASTRNQVQEQMQSSCVDDPVGHVSICAPKSHPRSRAVSAYTVNSALQTPLSVQQPWGQETILTFPLHPLRADTQANFTIWAVGCAFGGNTKVWSHRYQFLPLPRTPSFLVHSNVYPKMTHASSLDEIPLDSDLIIDCSSDNNPDEQVIACVLDLTDVSSSDIIPHAVQSPGHEHPFCDRGFGVSPTLHCTNHTAAGLIGKSSYALKNGMTVIGGVSDHFTLGAVCCSLGGVSPSLSASKSKSVVIAPIPDGQTGVPVAVASFAPIGKPMSPQFCLDDVRCNIPPSTSIDIDHAHMKIVSRDPSPRVTICFTVSPSNEHGEAPICTVDRPAQIVCGTGSYTYVIKSKKGNVGIDLLPFAKAVHSLQITLQAVACNFGGMSTVEQVSVVLTANRVGIPKLVFSPADAVQRQHLVPNNYVDPRLGSQPMLLYDPYRAHLAAQAAHADYVCLVVSLNPIDYAPCYTAHTVLPRCSCGGRDEFGADMCYGNFEGGDACTDLRGASAECNPDLPQGEEATCNLADPDVVGCCTPSYAIQRQLEKGGKRTIESIFGRSPTCPSLFYRVGQMNQKYPGPSNTFRVAVTAYCLDSTSSCAQQSCSQRDFWFQEQYIEPDPNRVENPAVLIV